MTEDTQAPPGPERGPRRRPPPPRGPGGPGGPRPPGGPPPGGPPQQGGPPPGGPPPGAPTPGPEGESGSGIDLKTLRSALRDPRHQGLSGRRFDRYDVEDEIARGGMGIVLRARHRELGSWVALKLLAQQDPSPEAVARFRREARVLAQIKHPNVVGISDLGEEAGVAFLAMELIEGETLQDWVEGLKAKGELPEFERAVEITLEIGRALAHCHEVGAIHRDVKPHNILLERGTGRPVLTDFGLVKRDSSKMASSNISGAISQTGKILGTPSYMSPEQFEPDGEFGAVGPKSDVWALGAVLFYALTGQPPFPSKNVVDLYGQVMSEQAPPPSELREEVPPALDELIALCLKKPVDERLGMSELVARLEKLHQEPHLLRPRSSGARHALLVVVLFVLLAIVHLSLIQPDQGRRLLALLQGGAAPAPEGPPDPGPASLAALEARAEQDPDAMLELAARLRAGADAPRDPARALALLRRAADAGSARGMVRLGEALATGEGVERDDPEAYKLFRKAADTGDPEAMLWVGVMVEAGRGVQAPEPAIALQWLDRAARDARGPLQERVSAARRKLLAAHPELAAEKTPR
ncbi:MAG: serine/threonine-protein kinase [Planctomycetota bacterium]